MKAPVQTLTTVAMAVAIFLWPDATEVLTFHRNVPIADGWFSLLAAQFTHWNPSHLICDGVAFLVLGSLIEIRSPALWRRVVGLSLVSVAVAVWLSPAGIAAYRGLSGVDAACFSVAALLIGREAVLGRNRPLLVLAVGCGVAMTAKIGWEWTTGIPLFARGAGTPFVTMPQVHLAGAIAGLISVWKAIGREKELARNRPDNRMIFP